MYNARQIAGIRRACQIGREVLDIAGAFGLVWLVMRGMCDMRGHVVSKKGGRRFDESKYTCRISISHCTHKPNQPNQTNNQPTFQAVR